MPRVSVIIVNYNVRHFLEACLETVQAAVAGIDADIWVVDNASTDSSISFLEELQSSSAAQGLKVIFNRENRGFSYANNQAIKACKSEHVLLLNPDTLIQEDSIATCLHEMDDHPETGAIGVHMLDGSGNFLRESKRGLPTPQVAFYKLFGLAKLFPRSQKFGAYHLGFLPEKKRAEVDVLAGCFMFVRRSVLDQCGLLDEDFFMYGEDIDLSYRIQQSGFKNIYLPATSIVHFKGESTKKESAKYVRVFYQAMSIFAKKHFSKERAGLFSLLLNSAIFFRGLLHLLARALGKLLGPLFDFAIVYAGLFFLKGIWENYVKAAEHLTYPKEFLTVNAPLYAFIWVLFCLIFGNYHKPFRKRAIFLGLFWGTLIISAIYGFLDETLRFSRALIIVGAFLSLALLMFSRFLRIKTSKNNSLLDEDSLSSSVFIGSGEEFRDLQELMSTSLSSFKVPSAISPIANYKLLGEQINKVVNLTKPNTLIFGDSLSIKTAIRIMQEKFATGRNFLFYRTSANLLIGSNSIKQRGEVLGQQEHFYLNHPQTKRLRNLSNVSCGLVLCLLHPFIFWAYRSKQANIRAWLKLLSSQALILKLSQESAGERERLFSLQEELTKRKLAPDTIQSLSLEIARNYTFSKELRYLINFAFGKEN